MKYCSICHKRKPFGEFYLRSAAENRYHAQCKECYKVQRQRSYKMHYIKYGDEYRIRARKRKARQYAALREKLIQYLKGKSCVVCGEKDIRTLEFDHINPGSKAFGISRGITDGRKWSDIQAEINKCQILCANCHKKRTAEQFGWYKQSLS